MIKLLTILISILILIHPCLPQESWSYYTFSNTGGKLGSDRVYAIAIDPNDAGKTIWFGCRPDENQGSVGGLSKLDTETGEWTLYTTDNSGLPHNRIWDIDFDSDGNMWIATHGGGLAKFEPPYGNNNWTVFGEGSGIGYKNIYEIAIDHDGILWLGHGPDDAATAALTIFDRNANWYVFTANNSTLPENAVYAVTFDSEGNKWLGTKTQGIFKLNDNGTPFDPADDEWTHFTTGNGLAYDQINANAADYIAGNIWFGHDRQGGADQWDGSSWTNHLNDRMIRAVTHDWRNHVWCGEKRAHDECYGIFIYDGTTWENITEDNGLGWNVVNKITINNKTGDVWIGHDGSADGGGVSLLQGKVPPAPTSVENSDYSVVKGFSLSQNYPNPFNPETKIDYDIPQGVRAQVKLEIFNLPGQSISTLLNETQSSGHFSVRWDGKLSDGNVAPSGIYWYRLTAANHILTKRMVLVR